MWRRFSILSGTRYHRHRRNACCKGEDGPREHNPEGFATWTEHYPQTSDRDQLPHITGYWTNFKVAGMRLCWSCQQLSRAMSQRCIVCKIWFPPLRSAGQVPSASCCTTHLQGRGTSIGSTTLYEVLHVHLWISAMRCSQVSDGIRSRRRHCDSARSMLLCLASVPQATALRGS